MRYEENMALLTRLGRQYGFRPDLPLGLEDFFRNLLQSFDGDRSMARSWLEEQVKVKFTTMAERPQWRQEPEWLLWRGEPMVFVGQLDRKVGGMDVSFYVFKDRESGVTKVVTQVVGTVA